MIEKRRVYEAYKAVKSTGHTGPYHGGSADYALASVSMANNP